MKLFRVSWRDWPIVGAALLAACRYGYEVGTLEEDGSASGGSFGSSTASGSGGQAGEATTDTTTGGASNAGSGGTGGNPGGASSDSSGGGSSGGNSSGGNGSGSGGAGGTSTGGSGTGGTAGTGGAPEPGPIVHCDELPKLTSAPDLDGNPEPGLYLENVVPQGWSGPGGAPPSDVSMRFSAAWHESGLYFYIEVTDPDLVLADASDPLWYGDGVEIYVDHDGTMSAAPGFYDAPGTKQFVVQAPADDMNDSTRADMFIPEDIDRAWPSSQWIGTYASFGYVVEVLVVADDLDLSSWTLRAGDRVGIDLGHNVSHPTTQNGPWGSRLGQYFMRIADPAMGSVNDLPFWNSAVFCTPVLLDAP